MLRTLVHGARQLEQLVAEEIAPGVGVLEGVPPVDERRDQAVDRARLKARAACELDESELPGACQRLDSWLTACSPT